jgi:hypothetical protein
MSEKPLAAAPDPAVSAQKVLQLTASHLRAECLERHNADARPNEPDQRQRAFSKLTGRTARRTPACSNLEVIIPPAQLPMSQSGCGQSEPPSSFLDRETLSPRPATKC